MKLTDFDFKVPEELVAQRPLTERDASRMLVLNRKSGKISHHQFRDLPEFLTPKDFMVFNSSRVNKARLIGERSTGGKVEVFLLHNLGKGIYECLVKATAANKLGLEFSFGDSLKGTIVGQTDTPMIYRVELKATEGEIDFWIERYGRVPLPPYIKRQADGLDISRYQTIYAKDSGSVAAPTAGLHFTDETFKQLKAKGIDLEFVTLHVGLGTFQPIKVEDIDSHQMHREQFVVSDALKLRCTNAKKNGERVVCVGTTAVRALESAARGYTESTELFLKPGSEFKWVDVLFTNFHQPKSSLVVMLSAFVGDLELLKEAYSKAVEEKYRFFSYGDCMLVL
ncbi:MAG: tRNA preQ1(34) S-adenosylmethionine ribosyltransferase-isomerase QueA [Bdellovibrionota bacterium]